MGFTVALAPMAGYTDRSFRVICSRFGMDYSTTEMVSVKALFYGDKKTKRLMTVSPEEAPVSLQLFGDDGDQFASVIESLGDTLKAYRSIDINMGCPAPKIVKTGSGSALLKEPEKARNIIRASVQTSPVPVSVKVRKGFLEGDEEGMRIAEIAEEEGAAFVTVHGRSREAYYSGASDWNFIDRVAKNLSIPVIANGDIQTGEDALRFKEEGILGVAIGRGAIGNPFIFRTIGEALKGEDITPLREEEIVAVAKEHLSMSIEEKGEHLGVVEMRKHFIGYLKGFEHAKRHRSAILQLTDPKEIERYLDDLLQM
ncbi:TIM-barrel protein, nifR3 family [Aedoeadaptatus coxii]|uniref:tRNA dihydrouridine synthase n=1 Tax=Aedoeadaptatus coxii TaxID=755172 RepID=UPI00176617B5|nr:tRNA-dihydrouridine synthase [Peptoniphilus coxii]CAC9926486.1 TIM-barrel protein, nifR3 family [Peptoniphilus coxii]